MPSPPPHRVAAPNDYGLPVISMPSEREERLSHVLAELGNGTSRTVSIPSMGRNVSDLQEERETRSGERVRRQPQTYEEAFRHLAAPRTRFITRENTTFHRSPEPMSVEDRLASDNGVVTGRSNLPTPPREQSEEADSLFVPEQTDVRRPRIIRPTPLSNSWRPDSPINGLGDRNRSPTPADGWEIMQTTITPDVALPSADSSFTSAAVSQSFTSNETSLTEPDREPGLRTRSIINHDSDSESDSNGDEMLEDRDEREATAQYAQEMYLYEIQSEEGLSRVLHHRRAQAAEGNKFALANESAEIELGFRLIDEALTTEEGRRRVFDISQHRPRYERHFEDWIFSSRRDRRRRRRGQSSDDEQPCPQPEGRSTSEDAAREANAHVHDYFRRFTADSLADSHRASAGSHRASPPPEYEALPSDSAIEAFISHDPPEPYPVSPPTSRSQNEVSDLLLGGDEQDLNAVRRVVERLAQRDDVPDEWWMSMGLNLSRTRVRSRSPGSAARRSANARSRPMITREISRSPGSRRVRAGRDSASRL